MTCDPAAEQVRFCPASSRLIAASPPARGARLDRCLHPLIAFLLLLAGVAPVSKAARGEASPPNIVVILADDLGYGDLSCFGQQHFQTPRLDQMAQEGMKLTAHYSASPVCLPARYSMLTGLHQGSAYIRGNRWQLSMRPNPLDLTVATLLKNAGYRTALVGKSGVGHDDDPQIVLDKGFDHFFGYTSHGAAHRQFPPTLWRGTEEMTVDGNNGYTGEQYGGDLFVEDAIRFVEAHVREQEDSPFFLQLSLTQPHPDLAAPPEYLERFRGTFDEPPVNEQARQRFQRRQQGYLFTETPMADYAAMIAWTDDAVGKVLDALDEAGVGDNTLVIFTSDNGPPREGLADPAYHDSNGVYRGWKRDVYEGGIRVPTIVRWPARVQAGTASDTPSYFPDYLPTFCEAAGVDAPSGIDGLSFLPTLTGDGKQDVHAYLYWEFHEQGGKQALRRGAWKVVRLNVRDDPDGPVELYNLRDDPAEEEDLAAEHPGLAAELRAVLDAARRPSDDWRFGAKEDD